MQAQLDIKHAGPSISIQDTGRKGHLRYGVTASGVMDKLSYALGNVALGNDKPTPAIEISLGGISLTCTQGSVSVAVIGGSFSSLLNGQALPTWCMLTLNTQDTLTIKPGNWGSWTYLCFAGIVDSFEWLGSQSVHLKSGVCGTAILGGDTISVQHCKQHVNDVVSLGEPDQLKPTNTIRAVAGPQDRFFKPETLANFFNQTYAISADYDRMGMRFDGPTLPVAAALDMPSEPISRGSLQVPGHGNPICLMADHHTAGGYPKIATVISADLDNLAQCRTGDSINFKQVSLAEAIAAARDREKLSCQLREHIMLNPEGMANRLWEHNLISGATNGRSIEDI